MMKVYSNPDREFGLFVYEQSWMGIFTAGLDGKRVQVECVKRADGFFDAFMLAAVPPGDEFPPPKQHTKPKLGMVELVAFNDDAATLRFVFDRYMLGAPAVDFSPMPERDITGTVTLARIV